MRLGKGGFLEEEPGERQPKTEIDPVGRPEAGTTQAHGESKQHRIEIYDKDSLSKERQEAGWPGKPSQSGTRDETVRPLPGERAWDYSVEQRTRLLRLARRRVWTLVAAFGALAILFIGTSALLRADGVSWSTVIFVAVPFEAAAAALALVFVVLLLAKARFDEQVKYWLDPAMQDQILTRSLQFGDPRGDGIAGSYVTRNSLTKAIDDRDGKRHRRSELLLPLECQGRTMRSLVTEISLRRWWELGLLEETPVVDRGELRFAFSGTAIQYSRSTNAE